MMDGLGKIPFHQRRIKRILIRTDGRIFLNEWPHPLKQTLKGSGTVVGPPPVFPAGNFRQGSGCGNPRYFESQQAPGFMLDGQGHRQGFAFGVFQSNEIVHLEMLDLGKGREEPLLTFPRHFRQECQLPGDGNPMDVEQKGGASHGNTGAEQLEHLGVDSAFVLPVGLLESGCRKVKLAGFALHPFHPFSVGRPEIGPILNDG